MEEIIEIDIKKAVPTTGGWAVFLGNEEKTFVIYVGTSEGTAISMFMNKVKKLRPLTHDLMGRIFAGLEISIEKVLINDLKDNTFYARLFLKEENELGKKFVEIDARPSDCLAIAKQQNVKIFVSKHVYERVPDTSELLGQLGGD